MTPEVDFHREAEILVGRRLGLRLPEDRRADLARVFREGLRSSRLPSPEAYLAWLASQPDTSAEWGRIASGLTIGETYFFRDRACFDALERHVLPNLIASRRREGLRRLRFWSAGCATGEEPYSLAIMLDHLIPDRASWAITVLGTDVNRQALEIAQRGRYRKWSFRDTPSWVRERYFHTVRGDVLELDASIRDRVTFAPLNLAEDGYPSLVTNTSAMDLILCRNVLMYFGADAQRDAVARLQRALVTGGWLVLSPVEASPELVRPLLPITLGGAVLHRKDRPFEVPSAPASWGPESTPTDVELPAALKAAVPAPAPPPEAPAEEIVPAPSLAEARAMADQGRLESARGLCEAALSRDRLDAEAHLLLAAICQELGDVPAALEGLRRAIYLAPDSAPAHFLLGTLLLRAGQRARGRRSLESAVELLASLPGDEAVDGAGGLTARRLKEMARDYLAKE